MGSAGDPQEHPVGRDHSGCPLYRVLKQRLPPKKKFLEEIWLLAKELLGEGPSNMSSSLV